ncbi:unnamed protein product [Miscanthus lutarioriparius]|uniref:Uncharacterized protein n=1 Tax=Miscanthus lutarioriparius TaxID=422564 RepID=A0A811PCW4_9POAL|nr:unnamed protein product [Miscanthus lutarioriparius]
MEELAESLARSIHLLESALGPDPMTRGSPAAVCPRGGGCRGPALPVGRGGHQAPSRMGQESHGHGSSRSGHARGHWRPAEDAKLKDLVAQYGPQNLNLIANNLHGRSGKSCRLRWFNQLDPRLNRRPFSSSEEERLLAAHRAYGNKQREQQSGAPRPRRRKPSWSSSSSSAVVDVRHQHASSPMPFRAGIHPEAAAAAATRARAYSDGESDESVSTSGTDLSLGSVCGAVPCFHHQSSYDAGTTCLLHCMLCSVPSPARHRAAASDDGCGKLALPFFDFLGVGAT